jgi:hypothetical protein
MQAVYPDPRIRSVSKLYLLVRIRIWIHDLKYEFFELKIHNIYRYKVNYVVNFQNFALRKQMKEKLGVYYAFLKAGRIQILVLIVIRNGQKKAGS